MNEKPLSNPGMYDPSTAWLLEDIRSVLQTQSLPHMLAHGFDRLAELHVSPADYQDILDVSRENWDPRIGSGSVSPLHSIRIVVDRHLEQGRCVPLDASGNVWTRNQ